MKGRKGRASLYLRGRMWWIKYYINGRPYRESTGAQDRRAAESVLDVRLADTARGHVVRPEGRRLTVSDLLGLVEQDYLVNGQKSLARVRYAAVHLTRYFGRKRAIWITPADLKGYIVRRQQAGAANATINRELAALRRGFALAHESGFFLSVPPVPRLRERNVRTGFFEPPEFLAVRRHLPPAIQPIVTFAYITGWRVQSEVLPLEWRQVDFEAGLVRLEPGSTKNDEGRAFPLIPELRALLDAQRERTRALERTTGRIVPWVFHRNGTPVRAFRKAWQTACRTAGLSGRIPHDFRRTAVRNLVRAGVPERVAMTLTGHRTRSVFDRYHIVSESDLKEAGLKLARTLNVGTVWAQPTQEGRSADPQPRRGQPGPEPARRRALKAEFRHNLGTIGKLGGRRGGLTC